MKHPKQVWAELQPKKGAVTNLNPTQFGGYQDAARPAEGEDD